MIGLNDKKMSEYRRITWTLESNKIKMERTHLFGQKFMEEIKYHYQRMVSDDDNKLSADDIVPFQGELRQKGDQFIWFFTLPSLTELRIIRDLNIYVFKNEFYMYVYKNDVNLTFQIYSVLPKSTKMNLMVEYTMFEFRSKKIAVRILLERFLEALCSAKKTARLKL